MSNNIIIASLKESFLAIKKNKKIFSLVIILQILFLFLILTASSFFISKMLQNTQNIIEYSNSLNADPDQSRLDILEKKNPLGDDPLLISRNYKELTKNMLLLLSSIFIIFSLINGLIWYFISNIKEKRIFSIKIIIFYLLKFFVLSFNLLLFFYIFIYELLKIIFSSFLSVSIINSLPALIISLIIVHFGFIALTLTNKISFDKKFKKTMKNIFFIGTKKIVSMIVSYLMFIILISLILALIYFSLELNLFLLFAGLVLLIFIFSWSKIYFNIFIKKLSSLV